MLIIRVKKESEKPYLYLANIEGDATKKSGIGMSIEEAVGNLICVNSDDLDIAVRTD